MDPCFNRHRDAHANHSACRLSHTPAKSWTPQSVQYKVRVHAGMASTCIHRSMIFAAMPAYGTVFNRHASPLLPLLNE